MTAPVSNPGARSLTDADVRTNLTEALRPAVLLRMLEIRDWTPERRRMHGMPAGCPNTRAASPPADPRWWAPLDELVALLAAESRVAA